MKTAVLAIYQCVCSCLPVIAYTYRKKEKPISGLPVPTPVSVATADGCVVTVEITENSLL